MVGRVEKYISKKIRENGAVHVTLIDPEKVDSASVAKFAQDVEACETSAIMVGGTTLVSSAHLDGIIRRIRQAVKIPVILFPNNITGISRYADAIWFMSLLNSYDPYFISGAQILGAPLVRMYGLEAIPLGYIIAGEGGSASVIGKAIPIPYNKPELASAHALAAQYLGMRFVYLEAGSGVREPIPPEMVKVVRRTIDVGLIVGGGIRTRDQAKEIASAGADVLVTSTVLEEREGTEAGTRLMEIIQGIKEGVAKRASLGTEGHA